jgi:hypothetical protein
MTTTATVPPAPLQEGQAPATQATQYAEPVWNEAAENAARSVAMLAMNDFARVDRDADAWSNALARWLTPQAASDFVDTDPAEVPVMEVIGPPKLVVDLNNGFGVTAIVPTDAGEYTVRLLRQSAEHPWKVTRIAPPG